MRESFQELSRNKNFQIIAFAYMGLIGIYFSFGNLMSLYLTPFGLTVEQISIGGCVNLLSGVCSAIFFGIFLDKTRIYKKSLIFISFGNIFSFLWLSFYTLPKASEDFPMLLLNFAFIGAFLFPAFPLCLTFSTEVTFPL